MIRHATNFLSDGYSGKNPTSDHSATFLIGCRHFIVNFHQHIGQWERPTFDLIKKKQSRLRESAHKFIRIRTPKAESSEVSNFILTLISLSLFPRLVIHPPSLPPSPPLALLFPFLPLPSVPLNWSLYLSAPP